MKKLISFSLLAFIVLAFYGCPIGLDYSLGSPGSEKIDEALVGTWQISKGDGDVLKLRISKKTTNSYDVEVLERGEYYSLGTDQLTGWTTTVKGEKFFYVKPDIEEKYYHYHYEISDNKLIVHDVSLLDGGVDAVTSTEELRGQVERSMSKEGWGQEKIEYERASLKNGN
jgi:hypothetical protein